MILIDVVYGKLDTAGVALELNRHQKAGLAASSKVFCNADAKGHADAGEPGVLQSHCKNLAESESPSLVLKLMTK